MARDLEHLLDSTAATPSRPVDAAALVHRVRRRRRTRRTVQAVTSVAAVAVVVLIAAPLLRPPTVQLAPGDQPDIAVDPPMDPADGGSQTVEDAVRDGVVPAIAALPFDERVGVEQRIVTPEGVWVISGLTDAVIDRAREDGCAIGDFTSPSALDGRDALCVDEYGEVLLLDDAGGRILRAYPLPGVPPQVLSLGEDAVYCGRQGDGALPDSMLCRVDRGSFVPLVRVFPGQAGVVYGGGTNRWTPDWWVIEAPADQPQVFQSLDARPGALVLEGPGGIRQADPSTLELRP